MSTHMPLRPTTIRFARDAADIIQRAANEVGCSFAQFVREAALMRATLVLARKDSDLAKLATEVERLARRED